MNSTRTQNLHLSIDTVKAQIETWLRATTHINDDEELVELIIKPEDMGTDYLLPMIIKTKKIKEVQVIKYGKKAGL